MKSVFTICLYLFVNRSLGALIQMTTTTIAPKTASEIAFMYQSYLNDLSEKKDIEKMKVELNLESGESIGDVSTVLSCFYMKQKEFEHVPAFSIL